ncbi:DEAD/DEAH box helicase family protein [Mesorhizobium sp. BR1-1-12]|uniref:type III restriction-modification system endonuclease n=1 Tax=unclassified Mesorhizobium TaxID=325217 RepID=UPI001CCB76FF|nr:MULTISPECIES: DEAD/DEAH box helicase family protein [unclassified Mesorhizobium]MBZ9917106.1 DEAD/DEAH box helicase family protein [Mesorhizobium sp. BR1-1-7]MBZ9968270.1 DEAD/DEAH box helicase family protein [Mesorhizobium sp. BR1-1-12]
MKLKFDPSLQYQQDAVEAVVGALAGQPFAQTAAMAFQSLQIGGLFQTELGMGNRLTIGDEEILKNVRAIQEANDIEKVASLAGREFSIEMETGTGKTYVYLRTIFELNKVYGFKKFIIVVPSVAVREGVLKSIDVTKEHFQTLFDKAPFDHFVYDSKRLGKVRQFASSNQIQIMVINIQSFQKDVADKDLADMTEDELKKLNVINRENDRMSGRRPIEFIQAANPIVIIDEPQSVDTTDKSRRAIRNLNPSATLRYSATHRNPYNLLYKLDPIKAYDLRLVKRIEVASVRSDDSFNDAFVKLISTDNTNGIRARIEIHREGVAGPKTTKLWVKQGDDLFVKSDEREAYRNGYIVQNIDCTPGSEYVEFNQGRFLGLGQETGGQADDIMKAQVYETVEQHLKKERTLKGKGIKVLSLFFIDRVANYRIYNEDGSTSLGKIGQWFEEAYRELTAKPIYKGLIPFAVSELHNGYFSQDKQGHPKDTRGNTSDDDDTYSLIMRDKERLLDPNVPLRFIFSHSALREGWDNPNVFQICTLNESQSIERKRQEIGRGLRLPVNESGERVYDETVNRLTVIANESYEEFARTLQSEFEEDFGIQFGRVEKIAFAKLLRRGEDGTETPVGQDGSVKLWGALVANGYLSAAGDILEKFDPKNPHFELKVPTEFTALRAEIVDEINRKLFKNRIVNARDRRELKFRKEVQLSPEFQALWDKIKHRTRYRVTFETADLVDKALARIKQIEAIRAPRVSTTVVEIEITDAGVAADKQIATRARDVEQVKVLPDILSFLQKETELTRHTLAEILKRSGRLAEFKINPQAFMAAVAKEISRALHELMLEGIKYEKVAGQHWEQSRLEQDAEEGIVRYLTNLYDVKHRDKAVFDAIEYESEVEKQFAHDLDSNENVKLFVKLPGWFKIDTPIGSYNPDWAFVTERDEKLYFVRETKSTLDNEERRTKENQKIACGRKHFETIGVDYDVVTSLAEVAI